MCNPPRCAGLHAPRPAPGVRRIQRPRVDPCCRARLVHDAAKSGFAGSAASAYERARPEYSEASVEWLLEGLLPTPLSDADAVTAHHGTSSSSSSLSTGTRHDVLDIGAGTGKLSRALLRSRPGLRVVGVDPSADMCMQYVEALSGDGTPAQMCCKVQPRISHSWTAL